MKRRQFITFAVGATVVGSGCLGEYKFSDGSQETTPSSTTRSKDTNKTGLQAAGLSCETKIVQTATDESPAIISIALTNETESKQRYSFGGGRLVSDFIGVRQNSDDKILLIPENMDGISIVDRNDDGELEVIPNSREGKCWTAIDRIISEDLLKQVSLKPSESLSEQFRVLSHDGCAPTGTYTFKNELLRDGDEFSWSLQVEYPIRED